MLDGNSAEAFRHIMIGIAAEDRRLVGIAEYALKEETERLTAEEWNSLFEAPAELLDDVRHYYGLDKEGIDQAFAIARRNTLDRIHDEQT